MKNPVKGLGRDRARWAAGASSKGVAAPHFRGIVAMGECGSVMLDLKIYGGKVKGLFSHEFPVS